ncbi:MAG: SLC13 family permease [Bacteroidales bacterium]|nr:SLC13 family permease [Bacteroidales bacterium]
MSNTNNNTPTKKIGLILGALSAILILILADLDPQKPEVTATLAVAVLMAVWWVTEAVPIAVTALLPVALFPLFGVMDGKDVSSVYFNHVIFLFIGGFLVAMAMEKHNLHKRIALRILLLTGTGHGKILFGFMFATAFLSMWMSNTATAMMMVPVAISIISKFSEILDKKDARKYSLSLLLGIAYSASVGGIATLIGTPPNLSFSRIFAIMFPAAPEITFSQWFVFALPVSLFMLFAAWAVLYLIYKTSSKSIIAGKDIFRQQYKELGKASFEEKIVFTAFITLALLWIFRSGITIESFEIPGWSSLFDNPKYINDGTVAVITAVILFVIPARSKPGTRILEKDSIRKLPWHIVLLFGGGFALAQGFSESGLAVWFGEQLKGIAGIHPFLIILLIAFFMSFLTELTSNTATTEMLLPILAGMAVAVKINPLIFMIPATMAASLAFMLPVATPPNAIVFGTNRIRIADMVRTGFILNLIGVIIVALAMYFWGQSVFDIDINVFPDWALKK